MSHDEKPGHAIVVGAGPAGLFTVFSLGMRRIRAVVIDTLPEPGGQVQALYPEKPIYDVPAYPKILGRELVERLMEQAAPFEPAYHMSEHAKTLTRTETGWRIDTVGGNSFEAPAIIIASGVGAFTPKRPPLEGLEAYEDKTVHYMVKHAQDFYGKRVAIAGGGDSAVDWAILLAEHADKLWLIHRRNEFKAAGDSVDKLRALAAEGRIELIAPGQLAELHGDDGNLSAVTVDDLAGNKTRLAAERLLCFFGLQAHPGPLASWGLAMEGGKVLIDPADMSTNLPGIFAAGDIATHPGKLKLILAGFAEAALAARSAHAFVYPGAALHEVHSSSMGLPVKKA